jgi:hypothetical protein
MSDKSEKSLLNVIKSLWKIFVVFFVILGGLASLQTIGLSDDLLNILNSAWMYFISIEIPLYSFFLFAIVFFIGFYSLRKFWVRHKEGSILDLPKARRVVLLCQTPQTTAFLRSDYEEQERRSSVVVLGGYNFDDYMKRLEKEGYLVYKEGKWHSTPKALDVIVRYHGDFNEK